MLTCLKYGSNLDIHYYNTSIDISVKSYTPCKHLPRSRSFQYGKMADIISEKYTFIDESCVIIYVDSKTSKKSF